MNYFLYAVIGAILFSLAGFYLFAAPVLGGAAGALIGAGCYGIFGSKSLNDRAGQ